MPFNYNPGGGSDKFDLSNTLSYAKHQNNTTEWDRTPIHQNVYKNQTFKRVSNSNSTNNAISSNNLLDRKTGTTGFKVNGTDVGNNLLGRTIIFHPNRHRNDITHNWVGVNRYNYYNDSGNTFGNHKTFNINVGNQWNHAAFVVQGAGGGGSHSNTYNGNGNSGAGGGGGALSLTGIQSINNHFGGRNFQIEVGSGGRGGEHWKYVQDTARDWPAQRGQRSLVYYYNKGGYYLLANGGEGKDGNHWTAQNSNPGGTAGGNGSWGGNRSGDAGEQGYGGAQRSGAGGKGAGYYIDGNWNNGYSNFTYRNYMKYDGGPSNNNNMPGSPAGGGWNWNYHGGPVTWNAPGWWQSAGGGGGGAAGNNAGNGRPGKGGGHGGDGYVAMFLYML